MSTVGFLFPLNRIFNVWNAFVALINEPIHDCATDLFIINANLILVTYIRVIMRMVVMLETLTYAETHLNNHSL